MGNKNESTKNHRGRKLYIVKQQQIDKKGRFSLFELDIRDGIDISYPNIKLADIKNKRRCHNLMGQQNHRLRNYLSKL